MQSRKTRLYRSQIGSSMTTVLLMAAVGSFFVAGMFSFLGPVYQKVSQGKVDKILRGSSEATLDWAVSELNKKPAGSVPDDLTADDASYTTQDSIPSRIVSGNGYCDVKSRVTVKNVSPSQNSYIYDESLDFKKHPELGGNYWRLVTATAQLGARSKTIQVVLKPNVQNELKQIPYVTDGIPVRMPFSTWAMFSKGELNANGNVETDAFDSRKGLYGGTNVDKLGGHVGSNSNARLDGNVIVGGNLDITNQRPMPGEPGYNEYQSSPPTNAEGASNVKIRGELNTNGGSAGFDSSNVGNDRPPTDTTPAIETNLEAAPKTFPPAPTAPADSIDKGAVNLNGNEVMTLGPGNYIFKSLHINGNAKLVTSGGPVNIYVQGSSTGTPIHINGNGIANTGRPTNVRMFYNGSGNVHINGNAGFKGLVYAPNSYVHINGNADYYGAIVGNEMDVNGNVKFHYDKAFGDVETAPWFWYTPKVTAYHSVPTPVLSSWKVVSWREL